MPFEEITCCRCERVIIGYKDGEITEGYFDMSDPEWAEYSNPGEDFVCNECMHKDERYLKDYPEGGPHV